MRTTKPLVNRENEPITFLRKRDYRIVRELGSGACGSTVLLHDDQIDEQFVCKKYQPVDPAYRAELYNRFIQEIKLLHKIYHPHVVRIFNYYLYPDRQTGFILMEHVDGTTIDVHAKKMSPKHMNVLFEQAVSGFAYLKQLGVLHRDIRPANLMVCGDGTLKIIDLGFGKQIEKEKDFEKKSITLNWFAEPPDEFASNRYDFQTEVYFVGKLFDYLIRENAIKDFQYGDVLKAMCSPSPDFRIKDFEEIAKKIANRKTPEVASEVYFEIEFSQEELNVYRTFAEELCKTIAEVGSDAKYISNVGAIRKLLGIAFQKVVLETVVPSPTLVLNCFFQGTYAFWPNSQRFGGPLPSGITVATLKRFREMFGTVSEEKAQVILTNLQTKFDTYKKRPTTDNDVPF